MNYLSVADVADLLDITRREVRRLMAMKMLCYDVVDGVYKCRYDDVMRYFHSGVIR